MSEEQALSEGNASGLLDSAPLPADHRRAEFEQFVLQQKDELINYIRRWVRSREDACDIAQEAFLRLFSLGYPNAVIHPRGFLYHTAKNLAADWLRRRVVREAYAVEEPLRLSQEDVLTPEHICVAREELKALKRAFELLPPRTRMALILIKEDQLAYEEVAARLGIKTHSARRLVERAMEFLVEAVSKETLSLNARGKR